MSARTEWVPPGDSGEFPSSPSPTTSPGGRPQSLLSELLDEFSTWSPALIAGWVLWTCLMGATVVFTAAYAAAHIGLFGLTGFVLRDSLMFAGISTLVAAAIVGVIVGPAANRAARAGR